MKKPNLAKVIKKELRALGYEFELTKINHGVQFRFYGGIILNVFDTGTTNWQGKRENRDDELDGIVERATIAWKGAQRLAALRTDAMNKRKPKQTGAIQYKMRGIFPLSKSMKAD